MQADHPLTRDEVIACYKKAIAELGIYYGQIWLGGGSALIMHGLRETTMDLDAGCTPRLMQILQTEHGFKAEEKTVEDGYLANCLLLPLPQYNMDLHTETGVRGTDLEQIDGVHVYTLEACLRQKQALLKRLNREKDQRDIDAIIRAMY